MNELSTCCTAQLQDGFGELSADTAECTRHPDVVVSIPDRELLRNTALSGRCAKSQIPDSHAQFASLQAVMIQLPLPRRSVSFLYV